MPAIFLSSIFLISGILDHSSFVTGENICFDFMDGPFVNAAFRICTHSVNIEYGVGICRCGRSVDMSITYSFHMGNIEVTVRRSGISIEDYTFLTALGAGRHTVGEPEDAAGRNGGEVAGWNVRIFIESF